MYWCFLLLTWYNIVAFVASCFVPTSEKIHIIMYNISYLVGLGDLRQLVCSGDFSLAGLFNSFLGVRPGNVEVLFINSNMFDEICSFLFIKINGRGRPLTTGQWNLVHNLFLLQNRPHLRPKLDHSVYYCKSVLRVKLAQKTITNNNCQKVLF